MIFSKYINEGFGAERICDYLNQHGYTKKKLKKNELNYFARSFIMKIPITSACTERRLTRRISAISE